MIAAVLCTVAFLNPGYQVTVKNLPELKPHREYAVFVFPGDIRRSPTIPEWSEPFAEVTSAEVWEGHNFGAGGNAFTRWQLLASC